MAVLLCKSPGAPGYREAWGAGDLETLCEIPVKVLPLIIGQAHRASSKNLGPISPSS